MISGDVEALKRALQKDPSMLRELDDASQFAAAEAVVALEDARYALDPYVWAVEQVVTKDEADQTVKPFPDLPYLKDLFYCLQNKKLLAIPKSRRMMVSWSVAVFLTWRARFFPNFAGFVQSETETKSAYVLDQRCKAVEDTLPVVFRRPYKAQRTVSGMVGTITYENGSYIKAVASGRDAMRSFTPSALFLDELEFVQNAHQTLVAALSFVEKGAQVIIASSSGGPHGPLAQMAKLANFERFS